MKRSIVYILCFLVTTGWTDLEKKGTAFASKPFAKKIPQPEPIKGIFSFGKGENFPQTSSLRLDYISGMSSIFSWASLEPQEDHYNFSEIDKELEWASKNGKKINICLYAGNLSPSWLASKKIPMIHWKGAQREDQSKREKSLNARKESSSNGMLSAPAFWEPTFIDYWKKFVSALAERYRNNPTVGYISITGATPKDLSTGTVIKDDDDWGKIVEVGYTHEKHLAAWKNSVDHFVKEFPDKPVVLALGPLRPGGGSTLKLSENLVDYIVDKKYRNVHFLCVILNDAWFKTSVISISLRNLFKKTRQNGHTFGYQMIYSAERMARFENQKNKLFQDYNEALTIAIEDGASWIEIWHDDIIDPQFRAEGKPNLKYVNEIKNAAERLK